MAHRAKHRVEALQRRVDRVIEGRQPNGNEKPKAPKLRTLRQLPVVRFLRTPVFK